MLTFFSNSLSRHVQFDQLEALDKEQLSAFHAELCETVGMLNTVITDAKNKERASGVPVDPDWLHRVSTKKRIALKFATEAHSRIHGGTTIEQRQKYEELYKQRLRAILVEEFGENELQEIEQEAMHAAKTDYRTWVETTKQPMWFVP